MLSCAGGFPYNCVVRDGLARKRASCLPKAYQHKRSMSEELLEPADSAQAAIVIAPMNSNANSSGTSATKRFRPQLNPIIGFLVSLPHMGSKTLASNNRLPEGGWPQMPNTSAAGRRPRRTSPTAGRTSQSSCSPTSRRRRPITAMGTKNGFAKGMRLLCVLVFYLGPAWHTDTSTQNVMNHCRRKSRNHLQAQNPEALPF
jgi:hypothetical protein